MKQEIIKYLKLGYTYTDIVSLLNCSKATISYHAKNIGMKKYNKPTYDWSEISSYFENHTRKECLDKFGFAKASWDKAIKRGDIMYKDFKIPINELLVVGRNTSRSHLKKRLINEGYLIDQCNCCLMKRWLDKPISLQLHHKNGVNNDNRLDNLCLLCPNCHSQTTTFAGRNSKKLT